MITLLHAVSYVMAVLGFVFVTLSLASGLLWIAEVIEEHTKLAKKIGRRSIYAVIGLHVLFLVVDKFPLWKIVFSIACHIVYLRNFSSSWPLINLTSPTFLSSCVLVLVDHYVWFRHFAAVAASARTPIRAGGPYSRPTHASYQNPKVYHQGVAFMDVASFFALCVWFIPLYLFLSLSANDNALPFLTSPQTPTSPSAPTGKKQPLVYTAFTSLARLLPRSVVPRRVRASWKREDAGGGLLAPASPGGVSPGGHTFGAGGGGGGGGGYEPWGNSSPAVYTPGGTAFQHSAQNSPFRSAISLPSATLTPPPPRRESSFNTPTGSPRLHPINLNVSGSNGPGQEAAVRRKSSLLALGGEGDGPRTGGKGDKDD